MLLMVQVSRDLQAEKSDGVSLCLREEGKLSSPLQWRADSGVFVFLGMLLASVCHVVVL